MSAHDVYSAFWNADCFAGLHALRGGLLGITMLVLIALLRLPPFRADDES